MDDAAIKSNGSFQNIQWNGRSIKDFLVFPRFDSIKAEALQSGLVPPEEFEKGVIQKAARYLKTAKCLKMKNTGYHQEYMGFKEGSPLRDVHLHALFLYTDFTAFCTAFSRTFRMKDGDESIEDVTARNGRYFHISKALRELIGEPAA